MPAPRRAGVLGPTCGVVGSFQAYLVLRILVGEEVCSGYFCEVNLADFTVRRLEFDGGRGCSACSGH